MDAGGRPTAWQEPVFAECTHGILLAPDESARREWAERFNQHGLLVIADLSSDLQGGNVLESDDVWVRGTLAGLARGAVAKGPAFDALVQRLTQLFAYSDTELRAHHLAQAPVELVLELEPLGRTLNALDQHGEWEPRHLPRVLDYMPAATPLGLYDRGPNWLYAALTLYAAPAPLFQFDVRLGWVTPPLLRLGAPAPDSPLQAHILPLADHTRVELSLRDAYLDYADAEELPIPFVPPEQGVVLSGKLPLWLWTAAALAYQTQPWLAIYQPQLQDRAVVVQSRGCALAVGQLVRSAPPRAVSA